VDEVDDEVESLYLALKRGLSAGWRKFSIDHELVDGDCLVFELIQRTTFKVRFCCLLHHLVFLLWSRAYAGNVLSGENGYAISHDLCTVSYVPNVSVIWFKNISVT
jgi:hypothetical protein